MLQSHQLSIPICYSRTWESQSLTVAQALPGIKTLYNICSLLCGLPKKPQYLPVSLNNWMFFWGFGFFFKLFHNPEGKWKFLVGNTWQEAKGSKQDRARGQQKFKSLHWNFTERWRTDRIRNSDRIVNGRLLGMGSPNCCSAAFLSFHIWFFLKPE